MMMKGEIVDIGSIIGEYQSLCKQIGDIEGTLKPLRKVQSGYCTSGFPNDDGKWETGIEKDERTSVKILYSELMRLRSSLNNLMEQHVYGLTNDIVDKASHGIRVDVKLPLMRTVSSEVL